jgi:hypothetical protein
LDSFGCIGVAGNNHRIRSSSKADDLSQHRAKRQALAVSEVPDANQVSGSAPERLELTRLGSEQVSRRAIFLTREREPRGGYFDAAKVCKTILPSRISRVSVANGNQGLASHRM